MTEKRFEGRFHGEMLVSVRDTQKDCNVNILQIIEIANALADENEQLQKENKKLKELVIEVDNELEIRDIVCGAGKFRLEEWGKHRYHQFYKGDEELEDESIVIMLMELEKENKELKQENEQLQFELKECNDNRRFSRRELKKENERIKHMIQEAYETERTSIGKNVLKQLMGAIK